MDNRLCVINAAKTKDGGISRRRCLARQKIDCKKIDLRPRLHWSELTGLHLEIPDNGVQFNRHALQIFGIGLHLFTALRDTIGGDIYF